MPSTQQPPQEVFAVVYKETIHVEGDERSTLKLNIEKIALLKGQAQHVLDQQFR